ncbi:MAG TPA: Rrf2 family transcriptional regulator [Kofleriaceae bacterium]|nr:Rrf2 family transcriptional regulator [Kofleriaceae bacterium]
MSRDSKLSGVLHLLLHMVQDRAPKTSETLAKAMDTNPVVVRRLMAGLRDHNLVRSEKGHGGGWTLACDPANVTLRDVYDALGQPALLAIANRNERAGCMVEASVNTALSKSFAEAQAILLVRFGELTLAMLSADIQKRLKQRGRLTKVKVHG